MQAIIVFAALYLFVVILALEAIYLLVRHRSRWQELLAATIIIGAVAFVISLIANRLIHDPRPFVVGGFKPLIPSSTDNGFPSDHVLLLSTAAAVTMVASYRVSLLGFFCAVLVGLARVYVGVHHFADIAGSIVIVRIAAAVYAGLIRVLKRLRTARSDDP